jgi:transcriptional regulator with XRE-family HTH domain
VGGSPDLGDGPVPPLAQLLTRAREARGLTRRAVEEALGIPARTIEKWETGAVKSPPINAVCRLAAFLEIEPDVLFASALAQPAPVLSAGAQLARQRARWGVSLEAAARIMRVPPARLTAWEADEEPIDSAALLRLVGAFGG